MAETATATKKTPPTNDLTVYVNGKILNRFSGFSVSHSIDTVPMSFNLEYGFSDGESETDLLNISQYTKAGKAAAKKTKARTITSGILTIGSKVEIYLEKQRVLTGYIENSSEGYSAGEHVLTVDGRSKTSVLVDSTTDINQTGMLPDTLVSLRDIAGYMFSGFDIDTVDKTTTPTKQPLVGYSQINLTTRPYDYVSNLCQYEGKLLYDDEFGRMVIGEIPAATKPDGTGVALVNTDTVSPTGEYYTKAAAKQLNSKQNKPPTKITDENSKFEHIAVHKTSLGRYRSYRVVINAYGGPSGIDSSLIQIPSTADPYPNELPPGKNITIVSDMAYPADGNVNGAVLFQKTLAQYMANNNWGRGQTVSATATGFKNPLTNKLWQINTLVNFDYEKPFIKGDFVVQSVTFSIEMNGGKKTDLVFVRREALLQEPVTLSPIIMGVDMPTNSDSTNSSQPKDQKLNVPDTPPDNAKPVATGSK